LCCVACILNQARFTLSKTLADRSALLIAEFEFQVVVPDEVLRGPEVKLEIVG
jgi:hypothetical protein